LTIILSNLRETWQSVPPPTSLSIRLVPLTTRGIRFCCPRETIRASPTGQVPSCIMLRFPYGLAMDRPECFMGLFLDQGADSPCGASTPGCAQTLGMLRQASDTSES